MNSFLGQALIARTLIALTLLVPASVIAAPTYKISYDVYEQQFDGENIDLLFVIDDSGSMSAHQQSLQAATLKFATAFNSMKANVHAAVISTSTDDGGWACAKIKSCNGAFNNGFISNRSGKNFADEIATRLTLGIDGVANEKFFEPVLLAVEKPLRHPGNDGFLRDNAKLIVVLLTDAEDQSSAISPNEFATRLVALKGGNAQNVAMIAGIIPSSGTQTQTCMRDDNYTQPVRIEESLKYLNGQAIHLCEASMADQIVKAVLANDRTGTTPIAVEHREFKLPVSPIFGSLKVSYGSQALRAGDVLGGWSFRSNTNKVIVGEKFDYSTQPAGTKLEIEFESAAWPSYKK